MPEYARPAINAPDFRDESGAAIRYGSRCTGAPPDDSYTRVSNPERFAPLQAIAEALIEHLRAAYRVDIAAIDESASATVKLVAVTPEAEDAAPLEFRFTDFPGVVMRAGVRYRAAFPACGCDACDETWQYAADAMERLVFAVRDGGFSERIVLPRRSGGKATLEHRIERSIGTVSSGVASDIEPERGLRDDAARLERLPGGRWQPWPHRSRSAGG